ncbi:hypothetical protein HOP50_09g56830 [Chloropicon primus]|uniref:Uncharacterized protein n=1 Tax=Chloropicon primus TaxID=1764295 RepID=A0A5B8MRR2_9CHLO|nr:hypothetical protein A3770_09p56610 [Chloropicon primus]UPR02357.1 hypothetical protein HOP50_09g56830 [Chloropicon primus]|eukprot:QDZ23143.1 hypothetical protein A3770_09p56610 [Chloropicon primus]
MAFSSQRRKSVSEFVKKRPNYPGLEDTFRNFCETKAGPAKSGFVEMDGKTFAKVFKDCGLMGNKKGQLSTISIDINFSKCKPKGERKIVYKDFLEAVHICATEMGLSYEELCEKIASTKGPKFEGTKGSTFVASSIDRPKVTEEVSLPPATEVEGLRQVFQAFNVFGGGDPDAMPNDRYIKLCKDTGVIDRKFDSTACDLVFSKIKPMGERKITYKMFRECVNHIAYQKGKDYKALAKTIVDAGGPANSGTKADAVKFHDDKNLWTGAYGEAVGRKAPVRKDSADGSVITPANELPSLPGLEDTFDSFCVGKITGVSSSGVDMDGVTFSKLFKDSGLMGEGQGQVNTIRIDLAFNAVKPKGDRRIVFAQFRQAVDLLSRDMGITYEELSSKIAECKGPIFAGTEGTTFVASTLVRERVIEDVQLDPPEEVPGLLEVFQAFNVFGGGDPDQMPNDRYIKLCQECGVIDAEYDTTKADLVFVKIKPKGARKIDYEKFKDVINLIAYQKSMGYLTLAQKIVEAGGPVNKGTVADSVKFHDDKELWTGAYGERVDRKAPERKAPRKASIVKAAGAVMALKKT